MTEKTLRKLIDHRRRIERDFIAVDRWKESLKKELKGINLQIENFEEDNKTLLDPEAEQG